MRFAAYARLLAKVDAHTQAIALRQAQNLTCHEGCSGCCGFHLSLAPVEARYLAAGLSSLPPAIRERVVANAQALARGQAEGPCPLLVEDRCALYERRPLLCRTHGLPVTGRELREQGRAFDVCPLNFTEEDPERQDVIDLDVLHALLFTVSAMFQEETKSPPDRVPIATALLEENDASPTS